jgi:hypothetical protein
MRQPKIRKQCGARAMLAFSKMISSKFRRTLFAAALISMPAVAFGQTAAPPNASVYIISPKDGDTVISPFKVQFGLAGMGVAPAGVGKRNTGHHHVYAAERAPFGTPG